MLDCDINLPLKKVLSNERATMSEIEKIAKTVSKLAKPKMRPKELFEAVRKVHPKATKKEITRGAFYAVIMAAGNQPGDVRGLHD